MATVGLVLLFAALGATVEANPRSDAAASPKVLQKVVGTWGWVEAPNTCQANPHTISVTPDGQGLILRYAHPTEMVGGESSIEARYEIRGSTNKSIRLALVAPMETRKRATGELVVWDLILDGRNKYRWRRTDWGQRLYTREIVRCPGK